MLVALLLVGSFGLLSAGIASTLESLFFFVSSPEPGRVFSLGYASASTTLLVLIAIFIGIFLLGCSLLLSVMTVNLYPTALHATGLGWAFGLGRLKPLRSRSSMGLQLVLIGHLWSFLVERRCFPCLRVLRNLAHAVSAIQCHQGELINNRNFSDCLTRLNYCMCLS